MWAKIFSDRIFLSSETILYIHARKSFNYEEINGQLFFCCVL